MLSLDTSVESITRVGAATAKRLRTLGIEKAEDLLFYFPFRYDDFTRTTPINRLQAGTSANVIGTIELIQNRRSFRRRMYVTEALVSDDTESLKVVWFNQPFIGKNLKIGDRVSLAGKIEDDGSGLQMSAPAYEKLYNHSGLRPPLPVKEGMISAEAIHTQGLVPNYHLTQGITQKQLRFIIKQAIGLAAQVKDWLPDSIKRKYKLNNLDRALVNIHFPKNARDFDEARRRLSFNELFILQIQAQLIRQEIAESRADRIKFKEPETKKFVNSLPFKLTDSQRHCAWEIIKDLERGQPMSRLLEGDVGSGKTVVAALAMLNVALDGKQSALLAPTEILAQQHFTTLSKLLAQSDIKIGLVTASKKKISNFSRERDPALRWQFTISNKIIKQKKLSNEAVIEDSDIVVGTHALIQEKVKFRNLALAVIDEQHRFGVDQRQRLLEKSGGSLTPHLLSMTATPIPRSLALALYGDLDISIIREMPAGRKKIITKIVAEDKRPAAYKFIRSQIEAGRQVFVICPLIDMSDRSGAKSVKEEFRKLDKQIFPDLPIGMLHGRLKAVEKEKVMRSFLERKIKILVSTSVVEVGVDVPNASIMMIEGAERFGLAQLHQFRGRVGRSDNQSYCFLFSEIETVKSLKRLQALVDSNDGLTLAKMDLKARGAGEVYGTAQSGFPELKIASLFDYALMKEAREAALEITALDPALAKHPDLLEKTALQAVNVHLE